jgi:hypothetical protein
VRDGTPTLRGRACRRAMERVWQRERRWRHAMKRQWKTRAIRRADKSDVLIAITAQRTLTFDLSTERTTRRCSFTMR